MTTIRITKLERHEGGFYTANVTAAGSDTVRVDNSIGPWTLPVDPHAELGARVTRREILPWAVVLLNKRVRAFERGEISDETEDHDGPVRATPVARRTSIDRGPRPVADPAEMIASTMAKAASEAVRRAA